MGTQTRTCTNPSPAGSGAVCTGISSQGCSIQSCPNTVITIKQAFILAFSTYKTNIPGYNAAVIRAEANWAKLDAAGLTVYKVEPYTASNCADCVLVTFYYRPPAGALITTVGQVSAAVQAGSSNDTTTGTMQLASGYQTEVTESPEETGSESSDNTFLYAGIGGGAGVVILGIVAFVCYRQRQGKSATAKTITTINADVSTPKPVAAVAVQMQPVAAVARIPPPAPSSGPRPGSPWSKVFDENTKQYYYFNSTTNESLWTKPADF
jgi:hypothetical protein